MNVGLLDVDGHNFPNLALMKLSAWHKAKGDVVQRITLPTIEHYDRVYVAKVFGDEYSQLAEECLNADEVIYGGTGFAIDVENGEEVFKADKHGNLPYEIEHIYPDYSLYPEYTKYTAYGFLTRGCPNNCSFCIVSKKEGRQSTKVADLSEWWDGQKKIELLDPNILACKDRLELLQQLADSGASVNFNQGLDARLITPEVVEVLKQIKIRMVHFAFDFMKNEAAIVRGLELFGANTTISSRNRIVYMLTNYDTTLEQDIYRLKKIAELGYTPDVRVYRKSTAPRAVKDLQRYSNNRFIYQSCALEDYVPRADGKTFKELYLGGG